MDPEVAKKIEDAHDSGQFNKKIPIVTGNGAVLVDHQGNEYIDCVGGHGVSVLGYSHPRIVNAVCNYMKSQRPITCGHFYDESRAELIERLVSLTPESLERVFFCNSGTESVEAALKFAMKFRKDVKDKEIIAFKRAFHGRTLGALSATFEPRYRADYTILPGVTHVSYNSADAVREAITANTVAIIIELVQGEQGVYPADPGFPRELREICDEKNVALIFDEVQTGFGRTGKMFALEHWDVAPDILCLAKGIAAGIPMGATITTNKVMATVETGAHGTTFGGNPFASAVALESLNIFRDDNLLENARLVSDYFFPALNHLKDQYKLIKEIRGLGLMIGIQFRTKVGDIIEALREKGVLALTAGLTVLRLLPPLVITLDQAKRVIEAVESVLQGMEK